MCLEGTTDDWKGYILGGGEGEGLLNGLLTSVMAVLRSPLQQLVSRMKKHQLLGLREESIKCVILGRGIIKM